MSDDNNAGRKRKMESETKPADPYLVAHPDSTPRLNAAMAKAMGMMEAAKKDSKNPAYLRDGKPSTYADLANVIAAVRDAFAACEIAYPQTTVNNAEGVTVYTHLRHSSGESMVSPFWVPVVKKDPQGYGSATTYARRFGLMAMAGIAPADDDDGNEHSVDPKVRARVEKAAPKPLDTAKLVTAFIGLGVTAAQLEDRIGHPLTEATAADVVELRAYFAKKKAMATETAEALALRLEQEKAEAAIAAEKAAKLEGPAKPDAVERVKVFGVFVDHIRAVTSVEALILLGAEFGQSQLPQADLKILQRQYSDRLLVLQDSARQKTKRPPLEIQDVTQ